MKYEQIARNVLGVIALMWLSNPVVATTSDATEPDGDSIELVDPTQPNWFGIQKAKKKYSKAPRLNSLVNGAGRRLAVINGLMMREGDTKEGITLNEITDDGVRITTRSGKKRELRLARTKGLSPEKSSAGSQESARAGTR